MAIARANLVDLAASRDKLREIAQHRGVRHLVNMRGCPLR
jgi:hypothetical protein